MTTATDNNVAIERHPLEPFLPQNARILMLGSFPPARKRWSMEFFYPNWINDMWRIMGLIFFDDPHRFEIRGEKRFNQESIEALCRDKGIALYDTACAIRRLKDNASDKYLQVVEMSNIEALLRQLPNCTAIVTTGEKATQVIVEQVGCNPPEVDGFTEFFFDSRKLRLWRMPSSSRAYPLPLAQKAQHYALMLKKESILERA